MVARSSLKQRISCPFPENERSVLWGILVIILHAHSSVHFHFGVSFIKACSGEALILISLPVFRYEFKMIELCNPFFQGFEKQNNK